MYTNTQEQVYTVMLGRDYSMVNGMSRMSDNREYKLLSNSVKEVAQFSFTLHEELSCIFLQHQEAFGHKNTQKFL